MMKKSKNTFALNKQKIASLDKELKNNIKGGTIIQQTIFTQDPITQGTNCYYCPSDSQVESCFTF